MDATVRKSNVPIEKPDRRMQPFRLPLIRIAQPADERCLCGESMGELLGVTCLRRHFFFSMRKTILLDNLGWSEPEFA